MTRRAITLTVAALLMLAGVSAARVHSPGATLSSRPESAVGPTASGGVRFDAALRELPIASTTTARAPKRPRASRSVVPPREMTPSRGGAATDGCGSWRELVGRYFHAEDVTRACRVLLCESSGDPNATEGTHHGLMQIAGGSFDPETNVRHASEMAYTTRKGWSHWACR